MSLNKIFFLRNNGAETHIYSMNLDGSDVIQITENIPVAGFNLEELDFTWKDENNRILYPYFDKLFSISPEGSALQLLHQTTNGNFITEIDWSTDVDKIAVKSNNNSGANKYIEGVSKSPFERLDNLGLERILQWYESLCPNQDVPT